MNAKTAALISFTFADKIFYPSINQTLITNVTANSVSLSVKLSSSGILYCAALSQIPTSIYAIQSNGYRAIANQTGWISLNIKQLVPSSQYSIYCFTSDFANHLMPFSQAVLPLASFSTPCCRKILVVSNPGSIPQFTATSLSPSLFQLQLDYPPLSTAVLSLSLKYYSCATGQLLPGSDAKLSPSSFIFSNVSGSLNAVCTVQGTTTGCYSIISRVKGSTFYTPANITFSIRNAKSAPPTPTLKSIQVSDSGSVILVIFSANTDMGSSKLSNDQTLFNCSVG